MSYEFPAHESTRKRRRWGCTCGCVMLLIVLIIVGGIGGYLGLKPNKEFARYALMDGEVDGFGVIRMNPHDAGMQDISHAIIKRFEAAAKAEPGGAARAKALNTFSKLSGNIFSRFFQPETMIYSTYNPVTADENILISAPLANWVSGGMIKQFVEENLQLKASGRDGKAELYPLGKTEMGTSIVMSMDPREIMISDNDPLLRKSLKYSRDSGREALPSEQLQFFIDQLSLDEPPDGEDLAFALINEESRITNLIFAFEDMVGISGISDQIAATLSTQKLSWSDVTGMVITADLASADQLNGQFVLYCQNSDTAMRLSRVFEAALPHIAGENSRYGFKVKGKSAPRGSTVQITIEVTGLKVWIQQLIPVPEAPVAGESASEAAPPETKQPATAGADEDDLPATALSNDE